MCVPITSALQMSLRQPKALLSHIKYQLRQLYTEFHALRRGVGRIVVQRNYKVNLHLAGGEQDNGLKQQVKTAG